MNVKTIKTVKATDTNPNTAQTTDVQKVTAQKAVSEKAASTKSALTKTSTTKTSTKKAEAKTLITTADVAKKTVTKKPVTAKKRTKTQANELPNAHQSTSSLSSSSSTEAVDPISSETIEQLFACQHADPFAVLGLHQNADRFFINALLPDAAEVHVKITVQTGLLIEPIKMIRVDPRGFFHLTFSKAQSAQLTHNTHYQFEAAWQNEQGEAHTVTLEDPYHFGLIIPDMDLWLLSEGKHLRPYQQLGAHITEIDSVKGVRFAVWAPNAQRVAVVGDFNFWDARRHSMRLRREAGIWEIFVPYATAGDHYKFEIRDCNGNTQQKADPYAFSAQLRPDTASIVTLLPEQIVPPATRYQANSFDQPISIYEVHLDSWRRHLEDHSWLSYQELAEQLIDYVKYMGFTHIELLPITEYPFDGSWGYQPTGLYAPTSRFGSPEDFRALITEAHTANIGVIMDWVPAHFPNDAHGLQQFDGTALYEHADPREGFHQDWNTLIFNYGRNEVRNYLIGSALYWVEHFGADALRVDAVSSMIYRDYSRAEGEWIPNHYGGRENLEAISLLQEANSIVGQQCQHAAMIAEESTDFSGVTLPPEHDGLGFHYKWNMGWMHDTLNYMRRDPIYRKHHHHQMTFGMMYHYTENFILSLSHDEVVHGKGSILSRMPGDEWQKFANLRAYYGYMWAHPGKKLLFMGSEFGQVREWHHDSSLDWHLLDDTEGFHAGVQTFVRDLNRLYQAYPPLYEQDYQHEGFEWLVVDDHEHSVYAFLRRDKQGNEILAISNFTPVPRYDYRIGVNNPGFYREILNSDSAFYHGSNLGNHGGVHSESQSAHHRAYSVSVTIPALSTVYFLLEREEAKQVKATKAAKATKKVSK